MESNFIKGEIHLHGSGGSFWDNLFSYLSLRKKLTKGAARILFIDDNKFPVVENLKKAGYAVEWIRDIKNLDNQKIVDAHIIFVDYRGVGKTLSQNKEGVGVCSMLKEKYKSSKYIVLFTGENIPNELVGEIKSASDENLSKNSETTELIKVIDAAIRQIKL
jgi:DNA-binding response OmpR family regulator